MFVSLLLVIALRTSDSSVIRKRQVPFDRGTRLLQSDGGTGKDLLTEISEERLNESSVWPWDRGLRKLQSGGGQSVAAPTVTVDETFPVSVTMGLVYGQGLSCSNEYTDCVPHDLLVDVYDPQMDGNAVPRPAMVVVHGGTEQTGSRTNDTNSLVSAEYFSRRGFVVFNIDYRLLDQHGLFPCQESGCECDPSVIWWRNPCYFYPPVRDYKAAIRWIRANSVRFNIDSNLIVGNGGSAGGTNILVAGYAAEDLYKNELLLQDETLASTNLQESSLIRMAVLHWPFTVAIGASIDVYGSEKFSAGQLPSVLHFHGSIDTYANVTEAIMTADDLRGRGVSYRLVMLDGCAHMAWCGSPYNDSRTCDGVIEESRLVVQKCVCKLGCSRQDEYSLPIIAEELGLNLI
eukprot:TRINITY_DN2355_c0_g3_i1.p1 TRINITY_DN2355_c0_g3~~TRINITY_DN2355_c0_g3_i1.p1  ORF type:complete len:403 (-),score=29.71 TRINITY_DN2355_c0_g3_i1:115-1323(-)